MFESADWNVVTIINMSKWKRRTKWMITMGILKRMETKKNQM